MKIRKRGAGRGRDAGGIRQCAVIRAGIEGPGIVTGIGCNQGIALGRSRIGAAKKVDCLTVQCPASQVQGRGDCIAAVYSQVNRTGRARVDGHRTQSCICRSGNVDQGTAQDIVVDIGRLAGQRYSAGTGIADDGSIADDTRFTRTDRSVCIGRNTDLACRRRTNSICYRHIIVRAQGNRPGTAVDVTGCCGNYNIRLVAIGIQGHGT